MILGFGTDIVATERIRDLLGKYGERFTHKVFTESERAYCESKADRGSHYAARFAAKEATRKALTGSPPLSWQDVEVIRAEDGQVSLKLLRKAAEVATQLGVKTTFVSLSHEKDMAVASVIVEGER